MEVEELKPSRSKTQTGITRQAPASNWFFVECIYHDQFQDKVGQADSDGINLPIDDDHLGKNWGLGPQPKPMATEIPVTASGVDDDSLPAAVELEVEHEVPLADDPDSPHESHRVHPDLNGGLASALFSHTTWLVLVLGFKMTH